MTIFNIGKGLVFELTEKYPVYDDEDNVIGETQPGDRAVITYDGHDENYFEVVIVTGEWAGYSNMALDNKDLKRSMLVRPKAENNGPYYLRKIKLRWHIDMNSGGVQCS